MPGPTPEPAAALPATQLLEVTIGIGAVVHVEQRALRAFEQQVGAGTGARSLSSRETSAIIGLSSLGVAHASS
jgi:hypothetical protein